MKRDTPITLTRPGKNIPWKKCTQREDEQKERLIRVNNRCHFEISLREEIVKSIESGTQRSVIVYQYGMSRAALSQWMRNCGSKEYRLKQLGSHLTDIEKRSVVRQVEQEVIYYIICGV